MNLLQDEQPWLVLRKLAVSVWIFTFASVAIGQEPEERPWMISARTAQGLGEKRETVTQPKTRVPERWVADVPEIGWQYLVIHHSGTAEGSVASIHAEHRRRVDASGNPWLGIGYHFVIGNGQGMPDGHVEATFRWKEQIHGAHSGNAAVNARGIGICLIGNFENHRPTDKQIQALKRLLTELSQRHQIPEARLLGHSDVKATACPGRHFDFSELRRVMVKTGTR